MTTILAKLLDFKGDDDDCAEADLPLEVTSRYRSRIEVAFSHRGHRYYMRFDLAELVRAAMTLDGVGSEEDSP